LVGNCLDSLHELEDESIDTCITSPPYYGLRDYGTAEWEGGDPNCEHTLSMNTKWNDPKRGKNVLRPEVAHRGGKSNACLNCGAKRIDEQIGLEDTPEQFIENLVEVFRLVKRKLKTTGTLWLNIGDSYWGGKGRSGAKSAEIQDARTDSLNMGYHNALGGKGRTRPTDKIHKEIKPKDLIGIPWMLAFALRADGWYLRQDIIWDKPNCMPESVKDRCTKSHEYIFLLSKSKKYYYDYEAIKEPVKDNWGTRNRSNGKYHNEGTGLTPHSGLEKNYTTKNKRSVWTVSPKPYREAHFAVFPPDLIEPCILAGCPTGGVVLDPFGGSGTTAGVAIKNNRKAILCELNENYISLIDERIASITNGWRKGQLTLEDF
jgi:DNA modification methylase